MPVTIPTIGECVSVGSLSVNNKVQQGAGWKDSYEEVAGTAGLRGRLTRMKGQRNLETGEVKISRSWEWVCRFTVLIENATEKKSLRWTIDNRVFVVSDYEQIDQKRSWYRFILNEEE
jgi:hypothetical protein